MLCKWLNNLHFKCKLFMKLTPDVLNWQLNTVTSPDFGQPMNVRIPTRSDFKWRPKSKFYALKNYYIDCVSITRPNFRHSKLFEIQTSRRPIFIMMPAQSWHHFFLKWLHIYHHLWGLQYLLYYHTLVLFVKTQFFIWIWDSKTGPPGPKAATLTVELSSLTRKIFFASFK